MHTHRYANVFDIFSILVPDVVVAVVVVVVAVVVAVVVVVVAFVVVVVNKNNAERAN